MTANNLHSETTFAKLLTEVNDLTLEYSHGEDSYTDGSHIVIAPCMMQIAADKNILKQTVQYLHWDKFKPEALHLDMESALFIVAHGLLIHECFHICYSTFPPLSGKDYSLNPTERELAGAISNIIEDAYIEAIGSSYYNNVHHYLRFLRTAVAFHNNKHRSHTKHKKILEEILKIHATKDTKTIMDKVAAERLDNAQRLTNYLNYVTEIVLFPLSNAKLEPELQELVDRTLPLFFKGTMQGTATKRYAYAKRILSIIKEYISLDQLPMKQLLQEAVEQEGIPMPGRKTHNKQSQSESEQEKRHSKNDSEENGEGQCLVPTCSLFGKADSYTKDGNDADTTPSNPPTESKIAGMNQSEATELQNFLEKLDQELAESKTPEILDLATPGFTRSLNGSDYGNPRHNAINISEMHYTPQKAYRMPYEEIVKEHQGIIKKYRTRFRELIQGRVNTFESGYRLGIGIDSGRLVDVKKRYWTRRCEDIATPELAVEIIIDGSGSMWGNKTFNAKIAAIIMHEVLTACSIPHCITQHYADFYQPVHIQQVLIDYNSRANDKFNLMRISANQDNRDGLALLWAEKHLRSSREENKVIIIISDGLPHHSYDSYSGIIGEEDTRQCAKLLSQRGIKVIAVAIEEGSHYIYDSLTPLYDNVISCNDMKLLPQKLGEIITNLLKS